MNKKNFSCENNYTINSNFSNDSSKGSTTLSPVLSKLKEANNFENFEISGKNENEKNYEEKKDLNLNFGNNPYNFCEKFHINENDGNFMKDENSFNDEIEDINSIEYIDTLNQGNWFNNEVLFGDN